MIILSRDTKAPKKNWPRNQEPSLSVIKVIWAALQDWKDLTKFVKKTQFLPLSKRKNELMYPIELTIPMARDLTNHGFEPLEDAAAVDAALGQESGTVLLVVNSVCGCAAANARPGAKMALEHTKRPEQAYTVFAGVHQVATAKAREFCFLTPPVALVLRCSKMANLSTFWSGTTLKAGAPKSLRLTSK